MHRVLFVINIWCPVMQLQNWRIFVAAFIALRLNFFPSPPDPSCDPGTESWQVQGAASSVLAWTVLLMSQN